ncbi:endonuclease domain-containing protein [Flaviaesturariibacter terrae]
MENTTPNTGNHYGYQLADPYYYGYLKKLAEEMRAVPTHAEMLLWNCVRGKKLDGHKFRRQHIIGRYIADIVCLRKRLLIEIDGLVHQLPDNIQSDKERQEALEAMGFTVIRFSNKEVETRLEQVLIRLRETLRSIPGIADKD